MLFWEGNLNALKMAVSTPEQQDRINRGRDIKGEKKSEMIIDSGKDKKRIECVIVTRRAAI